MEIKKDLFGNTPKIGDIIVFNPPKYKGLVYSSIIGFTKAGLPQVENIPYCLYNSVKTDFVIK